MTIRHWADALLHVDSLTIARQGMPSGNDLRFTNPGIRKQYS